MQPAGQKSRDQRQEPSRIANYYTSAPLRIRSGVNRTLAATKGSTTGVIDNAGIGEKLRIQQMHSIV